VRYYTVYIRRLRLQNANHFGRSTENIYTHNYTVLGEVSLRPFRRAGDLSLAHDDGYTSSPKYIYCMCVCVCVIRLASDPAENRLIRSNCVCAVIFSPRQLSSSSLFCRHSQFVNRCIPKHDKAVKVNCTGRVKAAVL
jgi:hypothetical protein